MMLCLYMCILMGKRLVVFLKNFYFKVFGLKMQKTYFLEKKILRVVFIKLTLRWLQTLSRKAKPERDLVLHKKTKSKP